MDEVEADGPDLGALVRCRGAQEPDAAEINKARRQGSAQRTVADFIADFRGLSGAVKRRGFREAVGASRESLEAFFARDDNDIRRLLVEMKAASRPVKPRDLGVIGEEHVLALIGGDP